MKQIIIISAILTVILITGSCTTSPICVTSSVTPLQGKVITENLGKTEGRDTAFSLLGLYMIGQPDLDIAIQDAVKLKRGDTLINVRCYETFAWFVLFSTTTVKVEGDAVKLGTAEIELKDKKKPKEKKK
jgi:hypothetical protein